MQAERERLITRTCDTLDCENAGSVSVKLPIGDVLHFCRGCAIGYARSGNLPFLEKRRDRWASPPAIVVTKRKP